MMLVCWATLAAIAALSGERTCGRGPRAHRFAHGSILRFRSVRAAHVRRAATGTCPVDRDDECRKHGDRSDAALIARVRIGEDSTNRRIGEKGEEHHGGKKRKLRVS